MNSSEVKIQNNDTTTKVIGNGHVKTAGPHMIWSNIGNSPIESIGNYLAKRKDTGEFYVIKILKDINDNSDIGVLGKNLIHTEYTILKILAEEKGVIQQHGLFKDIAEDENGIKYSRLCLVLDCYMKHDFSPEYTDLITVQDHVVACKGLSEAEALNIFYKILLIVKRLHDKNIVHQDLKLGNIVMNKATREIKLVNFCLAKQLGSEEELINDQRGSPAYAPPELIVGQPYHGKSADMWSLGITLYTMLYGRFPFHGDKPTSLFASIKKCEYKFPFTDTVSYGTTQLIQSLLQRDPKARLTCEQTIQKIIEFYPSITHVDDETKPADTPPQVVPDSEIKDIGEIKQIPESTFDNISGLVKLVNIVQTSNTSIPASSFKNEPKALSMRNLHKLFKPYTSSNRAGVQSCLRQLRVA